MKKKILAVLFILAGSSVFADELEWQLWDLNFALNGELRSRLAYLNNFDMDYDSSDGDIDWDVRGRLGLDVTGDFPLSGSLLLQYGNVELTDDLSWDSMLDFELKELFLEYEESAFDVKAGIIDLNTPGGYVYDSDEWGIQAKYDFDFMEAKFFYSPAELTDGSEENSNPFEDQDHLVFLGFEQEQYLELDLWGMYFHGDSDEITFNSYWAGAEAEKEIADFKVEAGYTYNWGEVDSMAVPLSAHFSHLEVEYEPDKQKTVFSRFNLVSGSNGSTDSTGQFQTLDGEGNLDTDLGLLFGGSPYSSDAYFDYESLSIVSDNLCDGEISFYDPGLFVYEAGFIMDFKKILPLDLETEIVVGGANTGDLFEGDGYFYSLIGLEADLHNKINFTENLEFDLSFCYLVPGNSFNAVYELNYGDTLDLDTSFKTDCRIRYSF